MSDQPPASSISTSPWTAPSITAQIQPASIKQGLAPQGSPDTACLPSPIARPCACLAMRCAIRSESPCHYVATTLLASLLAPCPSRVLSPCLIAATGHIAHFWPTSGMDGWMDAGREERGLLTLHLVCYTVCCFYTHNISMSELRNLHTGGII